MAVRVGGLGGLDNDRGMKGRGGRVDTSVGFVAGQMGGWLGGLETDGWRPGASYRTTVLAGLRRGDEKVGEGWVQDSNTESMR